MDVHDRIIVDIDDAGLWRDLPGDLVHVAGHGDAGADIDELPNPGFACQDAPLFAETPRFTRAIRRTSGH